MTWTGVFPAITTKLKADGALDVAATQASRTVVAPVNATRRQRRQHMLWGRLTFIVSLASVGEISARPGEAVAGPRPNATIRDTAAPAR